MDQEEEKRNYFLFLTLILNQNLRQTYFLFLNTLEESRKKVFLNTLLCYIQLSFFLPTKLSSHHRKLLPENFLSQIGKDEKLTAYLQQVETLFFLKESQFYVKISQPISSEYNCRFFHPEKQFERSLNAFLEDLKREVWVPIYELILPNFMQSQHYRDFFKGIFNEEYILVKYYDSFIHSFPILLIQRQEESENHIHKHSKI
jgi:hypothetical protein